MERVDMGHEELMQLDPLIHAPIRLAILSILCTVENANFTFLKDSINVTDGNLSAHLTKLEEAGYIGIQKTFRDKKPLTLCSVTNIGRKAFQNYLEHIQRFVESQKHDVK